MSQLPKIALNGTYIQKQASGLGVFNRNLLAELVKFEQDFEVALYTHADWLQAQYPQKSVAVDSQLAPDQGFSAHLRRLLWYQTQLKQDLKRQQAQLFFSPVTEGMFWPSIPQVVSVHDLIPLRYPELSPKWQYYYRYALPLLLKNSERIICISEHTKQDVVRQYQLDPAKIAVTYLGYDRQLFAPQPNSPVQQKYGLGKYLLYVGDMRFYKNLGRSLAAFDQLPSQDYQFVITGKKDDFFYPEIERQTKQLASRERIIFLDYVPTEDLPGLYSQAACLVFASLYEGFGLPVLEAMACGCPVLTARVTSIPEVGGDSVFYVDPYNVEDIAQGMHQLTSQPELRQQLQRQGLTQAQKFSWQQTATQVRDILQGCLKVA